MKNATKWNTELALALERLFFKDSVPEEWIEIIDKLERRWQGIADLIGFDFTNEDVVATIKNQFPVTNKKSALYIFDDAEEAINFFHDMRMIKGRRTLFDIRSRRESYSPSVQALIKICLEIINHELIALRHKPYVLFETIIFCMDSAIQKNDVTYESLRLFYSIIQDLAKFKTEWCKRFHEIIRGKQIARGKQKQVEIRKAYFDEFENYYADRRQKGEKISKHHAVSSFFKEKKEDNTFNAFWGSQKAFYRAYTDRKQPTKNKARLEEQQKKNSVLDIPTEMVDRLNKWFNDK